MQISSILTPRQIRCAVDASSKKRVLEIISDLLADSATHLTTGEIFDCLIARERLGTTGLGHGVALPHGRMQKGAKTVAAFVHTVNPIDYDAIDREPVDLFFALLVPGESTQEHLDMLGMLAELFSDEDLRERLRSLTRPEDVLETIAGWSVNARV